jgi:uncharacterized protein YkwD
MKLRVARIVTAVLLVLTISSSLTITAPTASAALRRERMLTWVNKARVNHGVRRLHMSDPVVKIARDHCLAMARQNRLFHSENLSYKLRSFEWSTWGENVGAGGDPYGLFKAYMASPAHKANILGKSFEHVGIAFVKRDGILWSTMIFYG